MKGEKVLYCNGLYKEIGPLSSERSIMIGGGREKKSLRGSDQDHAGFVTRSIDT